MKCCGNKKADVSLRNLITGATVALAAAVFYFNYGDIKRYFKMSMM